MASLLKHVDLSKPSLYLSLASITFNPTAWNIVARNGEPRSGPRFVEFGRESSGFYIVIVCCDCCSMISLSFGGDDDDASRFSLIPTLDPVLEYRNKTITKIFGGNARYGCYFLAASIFFAGMLRDSLYESL